MISNININNVSYDWKDIEVHFVGINYNPTGVSSINYNTNHDIQYNYSRTGFPTARKYGKWETYADITLDYYELSVFKRTYFEVLTTFMPIDVKVIYKSDDSVNTYVDTLYGCKLGFPDNLGGSQNDMSLEATVLLNPVWIKYGNPTVL